MTRCYGSNAELVLRQYKFLLVFENSVCDDYVSEKLWRALAIGAVPVYFGAANVRSRAKAFLPSPTAAILVTDFDSPQVSFLVGVKC